MKRKEANYYKPYVDPATGKTKYRYTGYYYELPVKGSEAKRLNLTFLGISAAQAAFFLVQGFLGNSGANAFYVLLPYVCTLLPIALSIWSSLQRLTHKGDFFTAIENRQCIQQLYVCALASMVLSACAALGEIVYMIRFAVSVKDCTFALLSAFNAVLGLGIIRLHKQNPAKISKKRTESE